MQDDTQERIGFVFLNGAGLEGRIWNEVVKGLDYPCLLVQFPQREGSDESRRNLSLTDYVAFIKKQVEGWETKRYVIVAHSIGGVLALRLAAELPDRLAGLVAVGAAIPSDGGSFVSVLPFPKRMIMSVVLRKMGTKPPEAVIRSGLCSDLTPDQATEVVRGFIPEAVRLYTDPVDAPVPNVPKLYVKLTDDKEFGQALQNKMIANLSPHSICSLTTGHLPMLRDPDGLRSILKNFMEHVNEGGFI